MTKNDLLICDTGGPYAGGRGMQMHPPTDQPKKKAFSRFAVEQPLRDKKCFVEKNKNHLFHRETLQKFAEKLL